MAKPNPNRPFNVGLLERSRGSMPAFMRLYRDLARRAKNSPTGRAVFERIRNRGNQNEST